MLFNQPESEMLQEIREKVDIPRGEARARLLRELELSDPNRQAPKLRRRSGAGWSAAFRLRLGDGLIAAGIWLAGRRSDVL